MFTLWNWKRRTAHRRPGGWTLWAIVVTAVLGLGACGGGGDDSTAASDDSGSGEVVIALTDAEGDFATYTVDVVSLTLTKANGAVVETLPVNTRRRVWASLRAFRG